MKQINRKNLTKFLKRVRKTANTNEVYNEDYDSDSSDVSQGERRQESEE